MLNDTSACWYQVPSAQKEIEPRRNSDHVSERKTKPRDLIGRSRLCDRHLDLEVTRRGNAKGNTWLHTPSPHAAALDCHLLPNSVAEECERTISCFEMPHQGKQLPTVADRMTNDIKEGLVYIDSPASDGLAAFQRSGPGVRREFEGPRGGYLTSKRRRRGS